MMEQVATISASPPRPLVSVVIPTYNMAEYVGAAIESVLAQAYGPVEVVVVDDGSTDETPEVLARFGKRITVITQENRGASVALNRGIRATAGELVCWLSADDEFLPGKLDVQVGLFSQTPGIGMVHTGYEVINREGAVLEVHDVPAVQHMDPFVTVFWRNSINGSTAMLPRLIFDELGGFDESLRADVDGDMWLRIAARYPIVVVPGVYVRYRVHGSALSANQRLMAHSMTAVRLRHLPELRRRVATTASSPATVFANMAAVFAAQHMTRMAGIMLWDSLRAGKARHAQLRATRGFLRAWGRDQLRRLRAVRPPRPGSS